MRRRSLTIVLGLALVAGGVWFGKRGEAEPVTPALVWRLAKPEAVTPQGDYSAPAWSPDGGALACVGGGATYRFTVADKSLKEVSRVRAGFKFFWTRAGDALIWRAQTPDKPLQIQRLDINTGRLTTFAEAADLGLPQETGDGVLQFRDGPRVRVCQSATGAALPVQNAVRPYVYQLRDEIFLSAGGQSRKLTKGDGQYFLPQLSPDGAKVLYQELSRGMFVADLTTGMTLNLGLGDDPSWSPDSRAIVFELTRDDGHNITSSELFVTDLRGRRAQLTRTPNLNEMRPAWSPDGKFIAFDADGRIYRAAILP